MSDDSKSELSDPAFLRDLADRIFRLATPAMGFHQHDSERLIWIAGEMANETLRQAKTDALEVVRTMAYDAHRIGWPVYEEAARIITTLDDQKDV